MGRAERGKTNPFRFGDLAIGKAFTDRESELRELRAAGVNGQNVVLYAPRRFGKSSLVRRVADDLKADGALVAQVNLMKTPSKERLVEALMKSIYEDVATPLIRAKEKAASIFKGARIVPKITLDPTDGSLSFGLEPGRASSDLDATLEHVLALPAELAARQRRRVLVVLDEFQEIVALDPKLPGVLRSVFQEQPDVAHFYLGSKRHMMEKIFNDENEPFWHSAKRIELGGIEAGDFVPFLEERFRSTGKTLPHDIAERMLEITNGHPYGTQELGYEVWQATSEGATAGADELTQGLEGVLRSENGHFALIWDTKTKNQQQILLALARSPGHVLSAAYRSRFGLAGASTVQHAVKGLVERDLVSKDRHGEYSIAEPFFCEWVVVANGS